MLKFLVDGVRFLLFSLDVVVYSLISGLYSLFRQIQEVRLFDPTTGDGQTLIQILASRIYIFIGIYMLFKLGFSLLTMMVSPETINDKEKGLGKITTRAAIMLCLTVAVPIIFNMAYEVQKPIADAIPKVFFNIDYSSVNDSQAGGIMAISTFNGFISKNEEAVDFGSLSGEEQACASQFDTIQNGLYEGTLYKISDYNKNDCLNASSGDEYLFNYNFIISTITGGIVAFMLVSFCIDLGTRVVKLAFLELIAPIPIMSYISPSSSKDGSFSKWVKITALTYLDLFTRILIISLTVFMITNLIKDPTVQAHTQENPLVLVALILGLLAFAKQAPDLIKDILGIKGDTNSFSLNPLKKVKDIPFAGKLAGLATGAVAAGATKAKSQIGGVAGGLVSKARGNSFAAGRETGFKGQFQDMAKQRLERSKARAEVKDRDSDLKKGEEIYNTFNSGGNPFKGGKNATKFMESMDNTNKSKKAMYSAQNMKMVAEQNYQAQVTKRTQLQTQLQNMKPSDSNYANISAQLNQSEKDIKVAYDSFVKASRMAGTAESVYNNFKNAHEKLRASDTANAKIQDKMDLYETVNVKNIDVQNYTK